MKKIECDACGEIVNDDICFLRSQTEMLEGRRKEGGYQLILNYKIVNNDCTNENIFPQDICPDCVRKIFMNGNKP